ncbi:substrate-binding domain-containing protein [Jejuia pallidilutea]|uniref:substrate-binding domain-containing protein n=1 Tax=Jejuia pallidilutea TaxID=504487 RepID=UPI0009DEEDCE
MSYIDRKPRSIKTQNCVLFDDYNLSYSLTKQIIERGYEKLMYINGPKEINISYNRLRGFKDALKDFNIKTPENWILHAGFDKNSSKEKFLEFLKNNSNLPQAVMCVNDSTAIGVYNACKKIGVKIPEDIAVTGFGHVKVSSLLNPPLTTVKLDLKKACEVAVEKLINLIDSNNTANKNTIIGGKIIFRASVKENI